MSYFSSRWSLVALLVALLWGCGGSESLPGDGSGSAKALLEESDGLLVQFESSLLDDWAGRKAILDAAGLKEAGALGSLAPGWVRAVPIQSATNLQQLINKVRNAGGVIAAEANYLVRAHATVPNDPAFAQQYSLHNTGQQGLEGVDIDAPEAWDIQRGSPVLVAVLDTGVDYFHPDLENNVWTNADEIDGNNIDDDGNGYVDDIHGWNFVTAASSAGDDNGHGTHIAGVIGAQGNNNEGIAGINWRARLMALKMLDSNGVGSVYSAVKALSYAVDNGALLSNISWGTAFYSQALFEAAQNAAEKKHLMIVSAGNEGADIENASMYPAAFDLDNIITVAAANERAQLASFSNFSGSGLVHVAAPGVGIYSTYIRDKQQDANPIGYAVLSGTSVAAAHVTGAVSLALSQQNRPDPWQLKQAMFNSAITNGAFADKVAAEGMLNVFGLLQLYVDTPVIEDGATSPVDIIGGDPVISVNTLNIGPGDQFDIPVVGGQHPFEWTSTNPQVATVSETGLLQAHTRGETQLSLIDANGVESNSLTVLVTQLGMLSLPPSNMAIGDSVTLEVAGGIGPFAWKVTGDSNAASIRADEFDSSRATLTVKQPGNFQVELVDMASTSVLRYVTKPVSVIAADVSIHIPASTNVLLGESLQLNASHLEGTLVWRSSDEAIASIDSATGLLSALQRGSVTITASNEFGQSDSIVIKVNLLPIQIAVPASDTLWVGSDTLQLNVSGGLAPYTWASLTPDVLTVNTNGFVSPKDFAPASLADASRSAMVEVSDAEGNVDTLTLVVNRLHVSSPVSALVIGDTMTLDVFAKTTSLNWTFSGNGVSTFNQSTRQLTADKSGNVTVTVTDADGNTATTQLSINTMPLNIMQPTTNELWLGNSAGNTLTLKAMNGQGPYVWSTDNPDIVQINASTGDVQGIKTGSALVRVTDELGNSNAVMITVKQINVTAATTTINAFDNLQLLADGVGNITWSIDNSAIASISPAGLLSTTASGNVTVTVSDELLNTASITINVGGLASLSVSAATNTLWLGNGSTTKLNVSGGKAPYTFTSQNAAIATVDADGFVLAKGVGSTFVTVTDSVGSTQTATFSVDAVSISASTSTIPTSTNLQLTGNGSGTLVWSVNSTNANISSTGVFSSAVAGSYTVTLTDALSNFKTMTINVTTPVALAINTSDSLSLWLGNGNTAQLNASGGVAPYTWNSDNTAVANVNSSGLVTAIGTGSTMIRLTDNNGAVSTVSVTVQTMTLTVPATNVAVGGQLQFNATGFGNITWTVSNGSLASITQNGLLTALTAGSVQVTATDELNNTISRSITLNATTPLSVSAQTTTQLWLGNGNQVQLDANGGQLPYAWSSNNAAVATVNSNGLVTAQGTGSTTIQLMDNNGDIQIISVSVQQIALTSSKTTIDVGEQLQFNASGFGNIAWSVSNSNASITQNGLVTAQSSGSVSVVVTDDLGNTTSRNITINALAPLLISAQSTTQLWLGNGNQVQLSGNGGQSPYSWSVSSGGSVVSVNSSGLVTAQSKGSATIRVTDALGTTNSIQVNVDAVSLSASRSSVEEGSTVQLSANGAGNLSFNVSGSGSGSVNNSSFVFTASAPGNVTVSVTDSNGNSDSVNISITAIPDLVITNANTDLWLGNGNSVQLSANGGSGSYNWSVSSGSGVVSVNSNGFVTAQNTGSATVRVTDQSGRSDTISFTVRETAISGSSSYTVNVGDTIQFSGTGAGSLSWSVSNTSLASIDNGGSFTALAGGTVTVTMRDSNNNSASNSVSVSINAPATGGGGTGGGGGGMGH